MEALLSKIENASLDATAVSGEAAIRFWEQIRQEIASSAMEKAQCYVISAEYRAELGQTEKSIEELRSSLALLSLPVDATFILSVKASLSERLVECGDYESALNEYVSSSNIAIENGFLDEYVQAVLGMGSLCDAYGDYTRALRYYRKIDAIAHAINQRTLMLRYKLCLLSCHLHLGRYPQAQQLLIECENLGVLVNDHILTSQILLFQTRLASQQKRLPDAIHALNKWVSQDKLSRSARLSAQFRLEQAQCCMELRRPDIAELLLLGLEKRVTFMSAPIIEKQLYPAFSGLYEQQENFQRALHYERKGYEIESHLMRNIPIRELGPNQLRRLTRFELQLKLILSEIENRELKEATENQKNTVAQLQQDVYTDPMTKLRNRRWLESKLKTLLDGSTEFAFLVVDIDHFKSINDQLSHLIGDQALQQVSAIMTEHFQFEGASCVRFGGEEFLMILEQTPHHLVTLHAEELRHSIEQFNWPDILESRQLTVSIGIARHRTGESTQRTLHRADKALYRAKANGRNQVAGEL